MSVDLHVDATWPLDHRVLPDRVIERSDKYICPCLSSGAYCCLHVRYQISSSFDAVRIGDGCREAERGNRTDRGQVQLRESAAGSWRNLCDNLLRRRSAKCRQHTGNEAVVILWRD